VRQISLRPRRGKYNLPDKEQTMEEGYMLKMIEVVVPNLSKLQKFTWDGHEMPEDLLWTTLRNW
jgi:hypothetical protein